MREGREVEILECRTGDSYFADPFLYFAGTITLSSSPSASYGLSSIISSRLFLTNGAVKALTASLLLASESWIALGASGFAGTTPLPRAFSRMRNLRSRLG